MLAEPNQKYKILNPKKVQVDIKLKKKLGVEPLAPSTKLEIKPLWKLWPSKKFSKTKIIRIGN